MSRDQLLQQIRELVTATNPELEGSEVVEDASFATLGFDSVKLVELGVRVEQVFGERVVLDDWVDREMQRDGERFTVRSLLDFIEDAKAAG